MDTEPELDVVIAPQADIIIDVVVAVHGIDLFHRGSRTDVSRNAAGGGIAAAAGTEDAAYWTVDEEKTVKDLWPLQPDAIVTNRPDRVREWIAELEMTE